MVRVSHRADGGGLHVDVSVSGLAIYLDTFALSDLAEGDPIRRQRFTSLFEAGMDLMFSVTNAAELSGLQGHSLDSARVLLNEIGRHWFPVELNAIEVANREQNGAKPGESCVSESFMNDYFHVRFKSVSPRSGKIIDLFGDFLNLGGVLDWAGPQRASIRAGTADMDRKLIGMVSKFRAEFERNPDWLNQKFPPRIFGQFDPLKPASFALGNLIKNLGPRSASTRRLLRTLERHTNRSYVEKHPLRASLGGTL
jgi:hypothetical protein